MWEIVAGAMGAESAMDVFPTTSPVTRDRYCTIVTIAGGASPNLSAALFTIFHLCTLSEHTSCYRAYPRMLSLRERSDECDFSVLDHA